MVGMEMGRVRVGLLVGIELDQSILWYRGGNRRVETDDGFVTRFCCEYGLQRTLFGLGGFSS